MSAVNRYDTQKIVRHIKRPNGHLLVPATLARTGVQVYRNADGSLRRELRLPEEVFNADALASLELVPVTLEHPPEMLNAQNTAKYAKGSVGENVTREGRYVKGRIAVTDSAAIEAVEKGDAAEISVGYKCELEHAPGTYEGQAYDYIQRNIRANHVSLTRKARGGSDIRVHLDAAESVAPEDITLKIKINGVEFEVGEDLAAAINAERKDSKDNADKAQARIDSLTDDLTKAKSAAPQADAIAKAVKARVALERKAASVGVKADKFDSLTDRQVMEVAIVHTYPNLKDKLAERSDAYVEARFDAAIEDKASEPSEENANLREDADDAQGEDREDSAKDERAKLIAENRNAWRKPIPGSK